MGRALNELPGGMDVSGLNEIGRRVATTVHGRLTTAGIWHGDERRATLALATAVQLYVAQRRFTERLLGAGKSLPPGIAEFEGALRHTARRLMVKMMLLDKKRVVTAPLDCTGMDEDIARLAGI